MKALIASLLAVLSTGLAMADRNELRSIQMTGDDFSAACTNPSESWVSFCDGYIQAVIDGLRETDNVCIPKWTTRTTIVTIAEREISASKSLQSMNAQGAVRSVLSRFYRCR